MNPGIGRVLFFCLIPSLAEPLGLALLETPPVLLLRGITLAAGFSLMLAAGLRWLPLALVIQGTAVLVPGLLSGDGAVGTGLVQALVMVVLSGGAVALLRHLLRGQPWFGSVGSMNLVLLTLLSLPLGWAGVHELLEPASGGFDARVLAIHSAWSQLTLPSLCLAPALVGLLVPGTFGPGRRFFDRASIHESGILIPLPVEVVLQAA
ncbi:MAG: hypothetical protein FJ098_12300, partial [Deltaproteobacteria bacterium]|nr:hypothetical protein [Deltaproteobacteria bacterium]